MPLNIISHTFCRILLPPPPAVAARAGLLVVPLRVPQAVVGEGLSQRVAGQALKEGLHCTEQEFF